MSGGRYAEGLAEDPLDGAAARGETPTIDPATGVDEVASEAGAGSEPAAAG